MVTRLLRLKSAPAPSDAADGAAAALAHIMSARIPRLGAVAPKPVPARPRGTGREKA
jgi:hypothetical protein